MNGCTNERKEPNGSRIFSWAACTIRESLLCAFFTSFIIGVFFGSCTFLIIPRDAMVYSVQRTISCSSMVAGTKGIKHANLTVSVLYNLSQIDCDSVISFITCDYSSFSNASEH